MLVRDEEFARNLQDREDGEREGVPGTNPLLLPRAQER